MTVSGRVTNGKRGIVRVRIYLTGQNGETRSAMTNSLGCFSFSEIQTGESYIVNAISKSNTFILCVISVNEDLFDFDFSTESAGWSQ